MVGRGVRRRRCRWWGGRATCSGLNAVRLPRVHTMANSIDILAGGSKRDTDSRVAQIAIHACMTVAASNSGRISNQAHEIPRKHDQGTGAIARSADCSNGNEPRCCQYCNLALIAPMARPTS